jgi:DNA invertase Pin-like site-specific DNA recombinase
VPTALGEKSVKKVGRPKGQRRTDEKRAVCKKKIRQEKINEARRLYQEGMGKREIGKRLDVPESTVRAWLKRPKL